MRLEPRMKPYRILSLDGGGVRGAYQAVLLARLAEAVPAFLPSVRLFAGTSIGSINALSLASGMAAAELVSFFEKPMASLMIDANVGIADYQCRQILGRNAYFRFDEVLPRRVGTDERAALGELMQWAQSADLTAAVSWLEEKYLG